jgi:rod shape-determining protein MreD
MTSFYLQPIFIFLLAIFQTTLLDVFAAGQVTFDLTFVFTIFAGLWLKPVRGVILSFLLGFFLDCTVGPIWGLNMFLYVFFFYAALIVSDKINKENKGMLSLFTGVCLFMQGLLKIIFHWLLLDVDISYAIYRIFLPQAVLVGIVSPFIYNIFNYLEGWGNAEARQQARRL